MDNARDHSLAVDTNPQVAFTNFKLLSAESVRDIVSKVPKKSCALDPMPTKLVVQCLEELLPVIMSMINLSLQSGHFAKE